MEGLKRPRNLVATLTIAFMALSTVALLAAGLSQMLFNFQAQQESVAGRQQLIAQEAAEAVASFIQEKFIKSEAVIKVTNLGLASRQEQKDALGYLLGLDPAFRQVVLLDAQERELVALSRVSQVSAEKLMARAGSALFAQVRQGHRSISPVYVDEVTSEPMVILGIPVQDIFGEFQGTLLAEVNLKFMWDLVDRLQIGESGFAYVVDRQGNLLAFRDISRVLRGENLRALKNVAEFMNSSAPVDETPAGVSAGINGDLVATVYVPLGMPDWAVVIELPLAEAYRPVLRSTVISVLILLVVVALAGVLGSYLARRLAAPVLALTDVAARIAGGELNLEVTPAGPAEITRLAEVFNSMTARLRELIASLELRTRELEASQRVTFAASERVSPDELLDLVVNLVRDQFNLYHAQVYIVDREQGAAVLRQSTGYAGRQLLQRKHKIPLDATALVTKAIRTGEPVLVADVSKDPDFMSNPLLPETRSELVVPLKLGDEVIGVLDAQDRIPGRFGPSTVALFQSMADQIAILFENSNLLTRITEQTQVLTTFANQLRVAAEIARRLGTILDPDQLLEQAVELLQSRFGLYHAHIYLLDEAEGKLVMRAGAGEVGRILRKRGHAIPLDMERSMVARAARERETIVSNDTSLEPSFLPNPLLPQTRSEVSIPLIVGDRVLGVLDIQDDQVNRFSQADVDTFTTLAGGIATALQTASTFEETQIRLRVSQALAGARTEEEVWDALIKQAGLYPRTHVSLYTQETEGGEQYAVIRRAQSFDSRIKITVQPDLRFPVSQFRLIEQAEVDGIFVSANLAADERADPMAREMARQTGVVSMAIVPIAIGDEQLGSIVVSSEEENYFDRRKLVLYRTMAEQGATALRIARLYDETQKTAERLKEVDRLKSEFLASMSHELRTPLNSIIGYTEIMLMGLDSELDPELREDVQAIYDNGKHLLNLINDILDLAKIEAGRLNLNMEAVSLRSIVDTAANSVTGLLVNKPIEFKVEVNEELPTIWGDPVRLNQILNNLLSNAIKFTDKGHVILRAFTQDGWACLEVEDTGIGISEADQKKLFERFQQLDSSNARKREGTGLGLAITRHLVTLHGGKITVKSKLGEGSTFTVYLPLDAQAKDGAIRASASPAT
ncbi:MAG: GAF domain-containing protein [Anaerolineae bacterium]|nr:GAF domain-containing protein [Anaerolineae bacterium]